MRLKDDLRRLDNNRRDLLNGTWRLREQVKYFERKEKERKEIAKQKYEEKERKEKIESEIKERVRIEEEERKGRDYEES